MLVILFLAQNTSALNMLVYGNVRVDGRLAPAGTAISARILDFEVGNCTVVEGGIYGILISTSEGEYTPIDFYSGNSRAIQVVTFTPKRVIMIDLDFKTVKETTTTTTRAELSTTVVQEPGITGRVVSFTTANGTTIGFILVFILISYSIRDLL